MRVLVAVLMVLPLLAGCSQAPAKPRLEGFVATYEWDDGYNTTLTLDGPVDRLGADLVLRPVYRLNYRYDGAWDWQDREASYYDGSGHKVRDDGCAISSGDCERYSVQWRSTFVPGYDISATGALWPLVDSPDLKRSWDGPTLVIRNVGPLYGGWCWEYEGTRPVPVRSCDGRTRLVHYERHDLPSIPAWPDAPSRPAAGAATNDLFPGAEEDLQGFGFTSLQALEALKANSAEAAQALANGGCVVTTLFGHGSGGFGGDPLFLVDPLLESAPITNISFTVQEGDSVTRTKYTLHWVHDNMMGNDRFSRTIDANGPDEEGGPTCEEARQQPWPAVSATEFFGWLSPLFGAPGDWSSVSRQPTFLARDPGLHYLYAGPKDAFWGGAGLYFDANAGRMGHASYIGDRDLP